MAITSKERDKPGTLLHIDVGLFKGSIGSVAENQRGTGVSVDLQVVPNGTPKRLWYALNEVTRAVVKT